MLGSEVEDEAMLLAEAGGVDIEPSESHQSDVEGDGDPVETEVGGAVASFIVSSFFHVRSCLWFSDGGFS